METAVSCDFCGTRDVPLRYCSGCMVAQYCSKKCQSLAWVHDLHSYLCPVLQAEADENTEEVELRTIIEESIEFLQHDESVGKSRPGSRRRRSRRKVYLSSTKARKILRDGSVRGHRLTARQKRYL